MSPATCISTTNSPKLMANNNPMADIDPKLHFHFDAWSSLYKCTYTYANGSWEVEQQLGQFSCYEVLDDSFEKAIQRLAEKKEEYTSIKRVCLGLIDGKKWNAPKYDVKFDSIVLDHVQGKYREDSEYDAVYVSGIRKPIEAELPYLEAALQKENDKQLLDKKDRMDRARRELERLEKELGPK